MYLGNIGSEGMLTLYDEAGKKVLTQAVVNGNNLLNTTALPSGICILNLATVEEP